MASDKPNVDVAHLLRLAKVWVDENQFFELQRDLEEVLHFVEILKHVDVDNVPPLRHPFIGSAPLRDDVERGPTSRSAIEGGADTVDGFVRVPKVIE